MNNQDKILEAIRQLQSLRNIGKITAEKLYAIGIKTPKQMKRSDPKMLYDKLRKKMGGRLDKCVLYQFQGAVLDIPGGNVKTLQKSCYLKMQDEISSNIVQVNNLNIHYLTAGEGKPVVLVHGWPTSSYLWRKIIPPLARKMRVIAPDLPGFGKSDKPLDASYTHNYHSRFLHDFLNKLNIRKVSLVLHDVGVPIGLLWAIRNPDKIERIAILDSLFYTDGSCKLFYTYNISLFRRYLMTVPYPKTPVLLKLLLLGIHTPGVRKLIFTQWPGIYLAMKLGVQNKRGMTRDIIKNYQAPFAGANGREMLKKTFLDLELDELEEIMHALPTIKVPVHIIYGENDWLFPHLGDENHRLQKDLPDARLTAVSDCGHFIQEDQPERLSELLVEFLSE